MPTIRPYSIPPVADAWHRVICPGGYEWWRFDAEDAQQNLYVTAGFFQGADSDPRLLRQYARYLRRPTRHAPPLPQQSVWIELGLYEDGRRIARGVVRCLPEDFSARCDRMDVRIGRCTASQDDAGVYHLSGIVPLQQSQTSKNGSLEFELRFQPLWSHPPIQQQLAGSGLSFQQHFWIIAAPLCAVDGKIRLPDRTIGFRGLGYHDHQFGTAPYAYRLRRWIRARALFDDRACILHLAQGASRLPDEIFVYQADAEGFRLIAASQPQIQWHWIPAAPIRCPTIVEITPTMRLTEPLVIDREPGGFRLRFQASCNGRDRPAFGQIVCPRSALWGALVGIVRGRSGQRVIAE